MPAFFYSNVDNLKPSISMLREPAASNSRFFLRPILREPQCSYLLIDISKVPPKSPFTEAPIGYLNLKAYPPFTIITNQRGYDGFAIGGVAGHS